MSKEDNTFYLMDEEEADGSFDGFDAEEDDADEYAEFYEDFDDD